jgi:large subunit ribosomal protein L21
MIPRLRPSSSLIKCITSRETFFIRIGIFNYVPKLIVAPFALHRKLSTEQTFPQPTPIPLIDSHTPVKPSPSSRKPSPLAPLLKNSNIYMTVHVNSFPYLISPNDTLHLPFHLPDAPLGSILRMTQVSRIGVRDYTLQGQPFIDEKAYSLKLRVIEHTKMPFVVTKKTKQRQRRTRHLFNKQNYTVLKYLSSCIGLTIGSAR